jgi:hypothetical protein
MRMDRVIVTNELLDLNAQQFFHIFLFFLSKEIRYKLHMVNSEMGAHDPTLSSLRLTYNLYQQIFTWQRGIRSHH